MVYINRLSLIISMLVLVGFIITVGFLAGFRMDSEPVYSWNDPRCVVTQNSSSYIIRPVVSSDMKTTSKIIFKSASDVLREFVIIDFEKKTQTEYLCPLYKVPVRIRTALFTTKGDVLATAYDKQSIYLFPESKMNVSPIVFELSTIGKSNVIIHLYAIPDSTGNKFWAVRPVKNGPTYVDIFDISSGNFSTAKLVGRYVPAGILENAIVLKGPAGVSIVETNGTVTDLVICPNIDRCVDIVATHDQFVAGIEYFRNVSYRLDDYSYPLLDISFGDLLVFDIATGKQYTIDRPAFGSWYTDTGYAQSQDVVTDIIRSDKIIMEFGTSRIPGERDWYIIDIANQSTQFLRSGTSYDYDHLRLFDTLDSQFLMFVPYNRTLYIIDQKKGNRMPMIVLSKEFDRFILGDVL